MEPAEMEARRLAEVPIENLEIVTETTEIANATITEAAEHQQVTSDLQPHNFWRNLKL